MCLPTLPSWFSRLLTLNTYKWRCILLLLVIVLADTQMNGENPIATRGGERRLGVRCSAPLSMPPQGVGLTRITALFATQVLCF